MTERIGSGAAASPAAESERVAKLEAEVRKLHTVLDGVEAYVYMKDREGRYTFANRKVCEFFGRSLDDVVGRTDRDFWAPETAAKIAEADAMVIATGEAAAIEELNCSASDATPRIFLSQKSPLRDAAGQLVGMCGISTDITERKQQLRALESTTALLQTVLNNLDAFVYMKDPELRFLYVNDKTAALFGQPIEAIVGRTNHEVLPREIADHFSATDRKVFAEGQKQVMEEMSVGADGRTHYYWSHKIPLFRGEQAYAYLGFSTDITELHETREELRRLAMTDALTGLYNRRYFMEAAEREFREAQRYREALSLISIDIDHFKWVNDAHGHPVGDEILTRIAHLLAEHARKSDLLARIGGEEFLLLLPHTALDAASTLAERIRQMIADCRFEGHWSGCIQPTISLGVTTQLEGDAGSPAHPCRPGAVRGQGLRTQPRVRHCWRAGCLPAAGSRLRRCLTGGASAGLLTASSPSRNSSCRGAGW